MVSVERRRLCHRAPRGSATLAWAATALNKWSSELPDGADSMADLVRQDQRQSDPPVEGLRGRHEGLVLPFRRDGAPRVAFVRHDVTLEGVPRQEWLPVNVSLRGLIEHRPQPAEVVRNLPIGRGPAGPNAACPPVIDEQLPVPQAQ